MRGTFARKENEDGGIFFNALFEHLVYSVKQRNKKERKRERKKERKKERKRALR